MNDFFYDSAINVFSFVCLGAVLGAVYDVFRVLRLSRKGGGNLSGGIYDKLKPKKGIMKRPVLKLKSHLLLNLA